MATPTYFYLVAACLCLGDVLSAEIRQPGPVSQAMKPHLTKKRSAPLEPIGASFGPDDDSDMIYAENNLFNPAFEPQSPTSPLSPSPSSLALKRSTLLRFGKRGSLLRFGKRGSGSLLRFGKRNGSLLRFGKRSGSLLRFGKRGDGTLFRFGRSGSMLKDAIASYNDQIAKRNSLLRFGKREDNDDSRLSEMDTDMEGYYGYPGYGMSDDVDSKRNINSFHWGGAEK